MSFKNKKIVEIEWEDAHSSTAYYQKDRPEKERVILCRTVGYLVEKNNHRIVVVAQSYNDGDMRYVHTIPRKMVRKITVLGR